MDSEIIDLLASYQDGFDQFSPEIIASHYILPCIISDVDGLICYDNSQKLVAKFALNCEKMKVMGYTGSDYSINDFKKLGGDKVLINVLWTVELTNGPFIFSTLYLCQNLDSVWKIFNAVVYDSIS